jgi:L-aminopeptidase/D-esterase-like protein
VLFDLGVGDASARPDAGSGRAACEAASEQVEEGAVGAGTGATVAKLFGPDRAVAGGIGSASVEESGVIVGAIAAVNAFGEIVDDDGTVIAGATGGVGEDAPPPRPGTNTTIAVVATDAKLDKERAHLLAVAAHRGLARAVRPAHTMWDGDTVFALATGMIDAPQSTLEQMAEDALARAVRRGVRRES